MGYRELCLSERGEQCDHCNCKTNIVVHHLDGNRENNCLENLVPLCASCHMKVHGGQKEYENYWRYLPDDMIADGIAEKQTTISMSEGTKKILASEKRGGETWDGCLQRLAEEPTGSVNEDIKEEIAELREQHEKFLEEIDHLPDRIVSDLREI